MKINKKYYKKYAKAVATKTDSKKNCTKAFLIGGTISLIAQGLNELYRIWFPNKMASTLVSVTLIFVTALLTGMGVFDNIAKHAGAGTLVPITGFANAVASPAIDDKSEGLVMGVGAQMFTIAGPVIVYGILTSVLYGFFYWLAGILI